MPVKIRDINYLTSEEVLERAQISRQTLWRWRQDNLVPMGHRHRNGRILFSEEEAEAIETYAHQIEPIEGGESPQLDLPLEAEPKMEDTDNG